jgi:hypothetical protein
MGFPSPINFLRNIVHADKCLGIDSRAVGSDAKLRVLLSDSNKKFNVSIKPFSETPLYPIHR